MGLLRETGSWWETNELSKAAYSNLRCEVKVGEQCSDALSVTNGLGQGCTLSPLLFSIYVNSLVGELKERGVGVMCGEQRIPTLLYADDTVILAESEEILRTGLRILKEWCNKWSVKINAEKCGILHTRKKGMKKSDDKFSIDEGAIEVMDHYKYLGCSLTEHLEYKLMLEERAKAGSRALAAWLSRCRMSVWEVKGETFIRLMEALVQSVLLYGPEVWSCGRKLGAVEQVQLRAARMFLGVSKLHSKVSLQFEMGMLPLEWEAKKRCIEFWWRILRFDDDRLVRQVALEVQRMSGKVRWLKELEQSLEKFEWQNVRMEDLERMPLGEVKCMLTDSAVWVVKQEWEEEAKIGSKLQMMGKLMEYDCKVRCVETGRKNLRQVLVTLGG